MSHSHHHGGRRSGKRSRATTKAQKIWRSVLAFFLCLAITALSLCVCIRTTFLGKNSLVSVVTDDQYVAAVKDDLLEYAHSLCDACGIAYDSVDSAITYDSIYNVEEAYISGLLGASQEYTSTTYQDLIAALGDNIEEQTKSMMEAKHIHADATLTNPAGIFADKIEDYLTQRVELPRAEKMATLINLATTGSWGGVVGFAILVLVLALVVISIGNKRYRAVRFTAYATLAAGALDFLLVGGVEIVKRHKQLVLYPLYFSETLLRYVNRCLTSVSLAGAVLVFLSVIIMCIVWKMDRDKKD